jgi:hypothetical protein
MLMPDRGAEKQAAVLGLMDTVDQSQLLQPAQDAVYSGQSQAGATPTGRYTDFHWGESPAAASQNRYNGAQGSRGTMPVFA